MVSETVLSHDLIFNLLVYTKKAELGIVYQQIEDLSDEITRWCWSFSCTFSYSEIYRKKF